MKNSQRKKIIIGYRYDPQSYTSQRLHQIQTIQSQFLDSYLPTDGVKQSFEVDQKLIEKLKNENSLLKAQLERMEQKSSFKSYQYLSQQYSLLENQLNRMKQQVQQLKNIIKQFEQRQKQRQAQIRQESKKQIQSKHQQRETQRKYTFAPYNYNSTFINTTLIGQQNDYFNGQKSYGKSSEIMKSSETNRNTTIDDSLASQKFYDMLNKQGQQDMSIRLNSNKELSQSEINENYDTFNPSSYQYKFTDPVIVDTDYMYNDLKTIESQKSHQLESQIQLGYNFSFMPKPLKKNINTLQALDEQDNTKVFSNERKVTFSSSHKEMINHKDDQSSYFHNPSQQSVCISQNQSESNIGKLNGLKKLPDKPLRSNKRTSNNSISISSDNN